MKHILIAFATLLLSLSVGKSQGLIGLGNSALTRITICDITGTERPVTANDGLRITVWVGQAGTSEGELSQVPGTDNIGIGSTAGILGGSLAAFPLAGTEGGQTVSLQIRATLNAGGSLVGEGRTKVAQVTLTSAPAAGAVIWQTATGTNPNRFTPLIIACPEPSTLALGGLACAFLLLRARKTFVRR